jgi:hypothetical protein
MAPADDGDDEVTYLPTVSGSQHRKGERGRKSQMQTIDHHGHRKRLKFRNALPVLSADEAPMHLGLEFIALSGIFKAPWT